jgi:hypothetical protein
MLTTAQIFNNQLQLVSEEAESKMLKAEFFTS